MKIWQTVPQFHIFYFQSLCKWMHRGFKGMRRHNMTSLCAHCVQDQVQFPMYEIDLEIKITFLLVLRVALTDWLVSLTVYWIGSSKIRFTLSGTLTMMTTKKTTVYQHFCQMLYPEACIQHVMDTTFFVFRLNQFFEDCQKNNFRLLTIVFPSFFYQTLVYLMAWLCNWRLPKNEFSVFWQLYFF